MEIFRIAIASNDGKYFNKEHFGDSDFYHLYDISYEEVKFIKTIRNTAKDIEEERHADPKKAGGVTQLLEKERVQLVCSGVFGPNIKRISKKFVCIIFPAGDLASSLDRIKASLEEITKEWKKGEEREFLLFD